MHFEMQGKINQLRALIRATGIKAGEDQEWLKKYEEDLIARWSSNLSDLDKAIACFHSIVSLMPQ